jgi:hypothetical protein
MTRRVIEDGNRRVILDRDEVIIQENGESVAVKSPDAEQTEHDHVRDGHRHDEAEGATRSRGPQTNGGAAAVRAVATLLVVAGFAVIGLLAARIALLALEADAGNRAVEAAYDITAPLIEPFEGIFSIQQLDGGGIFEPAAAIAAGVVLAAVLAVALLSRVAMRRTVRA